MHRNLTFFFLALIIISCRSDIQQSDTSKNILLNDSSKFNRKVDSNNLEDKNSTIGFDDIVKRVQLNYTEDSLINNPIFGRKIDTSSNQSSSQFDYLRNSLDNHRNNRESYWAFMLNLINNPYFQTERIDFPLNIYVIIDSNKTVRNFKIQKEALNHFLLDNHIGLYASRKVDKSNYTESTNQKVLTKIDQWKTTDFYFEHDSIWIIRGIIVTNKSKKDTLFKYGFEDYITMFASDNVYRNSHFVLPLLHEGYTEDMEGVDTVYVTEIDYLDRLIDRLFLIRHSFEKDIITNDTVFLKWSFNDNGVSFGHRFVKRQNTWFLDFEWDHSN